MSDPGQVARGSAGDLRKTAQAVLLSTSFGTMGRQLRKKPLALLGALGTMAAIWWYALRPRFRKRP
jgi:hypothetical protein